MCLCVYNINIANTCIIIKKILRSFSIALCSENNSFKKKCLHCYLFIFALPFIIHYIQNKFGDCFNLILTKCYFLVKFFLRYMFVTFYIAFYHNTFKQCLLTALIRTTCCKRFVDLISMCCQDIPAHYEGSDLIQSHWSLAYCNGIEQFHIISKKDATLGVIVIRGNLLQLELCV